MTLKIADVIILGEVNGVNMESLAYASIRHFSNIRLRLESCQVKAMHQYVMQPACVERFVYITKGDACFYVNETEVIAKEWDMVYLPRETAYHSQWLRASEFVVVDMQLCDENGASIRFGESPCVLFNDRNRIYDGLLAELAQKADTVGPFDWLERLYLSLKLLCEIARDTTSTESNENLIKPGIAYLENNFAEDFSIDALAEMCALSPGYFRKLFIAAKGTSPSDYRNRLRIRRAGELLRSGSYTIGEVAEQVGVNDIKYFSKLFMRYTGMTPSEFKKKPFV